MTRLDRLGLFVLLLFGALVLYLAACDEPPARASAGVVDGYGPPSSSSGGGGT